MSTEAEHWHTIPKSDRDVIVDERIARVMELPVFTLIRVGLRPPSGRIQGAIRYRVGDGLGPTGRDDYPRDILRRECESWVTHDWPWGFDVLATPSDPTAKCSIVTDADRDFGPN